jgi:hypothetical protein
LLTCPTLSITVNLRQLPTPVHLIHYLDDFLGTMFPPWPWRYLHYSASVALHRTACVIVFLGILIDSVAGELRLPTGELQPQELSPEEDMFQEGVGVLPGSSLSCCHCGVPGACFPPGTVQPLALGEAVTSCDTALRWSPAEVLPTVLVWAFFFPPPSITLWCFWLLGLWGLHGGCGLVSGPLAHY